jgi:PERQ amino acid-rich with GYF domain-containing protein
MIPRKLSQASTQLPLTSPREPSLPSPRTRLGYVPSFDGVFNGGDSWVARRKAAESLAKSSGANASESVEPDPKILDIHEEEEEKEREDEPAGIQSVESVDGGGPSLTAKSEGHSVDQQSVDLPAVTNVPAVNTASPPETLSTVLSAGPPPGLPDLSKVEWSYLDPQGQEQGTSTLRSHYCIRAHDVFAQVHSARI